MSGLQTTQVGWGPWRSLQGGSQGSQVSTQCSGAPLTPPIKANHPVSPLNLFSSQPSIPVPPCCSTLVPNPGHVTALLRGVQWVPSIWFEFYRVPWLWFHCLSLSWDIPSTLLPQDLCTYCSLFLGHPLSPGSLCDPSLLCLYVSAQLSLAVGLPVSQLRGCLCCLCSVLLPGLASPFL